MSAGPTRARPPFRFSVRLRVGFDETDAQAVVYYGRYFPYCDRARVEYQRHLQLLHSLPDGLEFVMRQTQCEYEAPARFDDEIDVELAITRLGTTSMTTTTAVRRDGELLVEGRIAHVFVDPATLAKKEIPERVRAGLAPYAVA